MTFKKTLSMTLALLAISALSIAKTQDKDIVDTAIGAGKFKTLVKLVQAADLVDTLKSAGPFTVLAPTDEAFAALGKRYPGLIDKLSSDKALLKKVLTYHVIKGTVLSTDLKDGASVETVEGEKIKVMVGEKGVSFNNKRTKVVIADVKASNGVVHAISSVLVPPSLRKTVASFRAKESN